MLDDLAYDDSEEPPVGLVPPGVSWDEVRDHIKIAHSPLLVGPAADGQYTGATGTSRPWSARGSAGWRRTCCRWRTAGSPMR